MKARSIAQVPDSVRGEGVGDLVTIRIDALAVGGDAVGRQQGGANDGRATFVARAAPGEIVRARLIRRKARVAWAELEGLVSPPAPSRVTPPCPWFGECGGCQWQHVSLAVQREAKRDIVARALGLPRAEVPLRVPSPGGVGYRDRARFIVGPGGTLGFRARRSHAVVPVTACGLLSVSLARVLSRLRTAPLPLPEGAEIDVQAGREGVHVRIRSSSPTSSRAGASPRSPSPSPSAKDWLGILGPAGVVGVVVATATGATLAGAADVDVSESESLPLRIPAGGFAQVGREANASLLAAAAEALGGDPGSVLELYAGSGNFTRHLCARGLRVAATDGDRDAVERGRRNAPGAAWRVASVGDAALAVNVDTVLADPPRGGLDAPSLQIAVAARRQIVYVSCDPQTLARDAAAMVRAGFALRSAVALDLMPHTSHVEVVARFERQVAQAPFPLPSPTKVGEGQGEGRG